MNTYIRTTLTSTVHDSCTNSCKKFSNSFFKISFTYICCSSMKRSYELLRDKFIYIT